MPAILFAYLLVPAACATQGSRLAVPAPRIVAWNGQFECALTSVANQGFMIIRDPQHPDQFEARRHNTPQSDILLVGVGILNDSARVGGVPVSNDDTRPPSRDARDAARILAEDCPPRPLR